MKTHILLTASLFIFPVNLTLASNETVNTLMQTYVTQGADAASAEHGKQLWLKTFKGKGDFTNRSCTSCHTQDLTAAGKHIKTNKVIGPMAPSVNPERLTDSKKIEKWFKRNCKWTLGRECTVQEKANFLAHIIKQ